MPLHATTTGQIKSETAGNGQNGPGSSALSRPSGLVTGGTSAPYCTERLDVVCPTSLIPSPLTRSYSPLLLPRNKSVITLPREDNTPACI